MLSLELLDTAEISSWSFGIPLRFVGQEFFDRMWLDVFQLNFNHTAINLYLGSGLTELLSEINSCCYREALASVALKC